MMSFLSSSAACFKFFEISKNILLTIEFVKLLRILLLPSTSDNFEDAFLVSRCLISSIDLLKVDSVSSTSIILNVSLSKLNSSSMMISASPNSFSRSFVLVSAISRKSSILNKPIPYSATSSEMSRGFAISTIKRSVFSNPIFSSLSFVMIE